MYSSAWGGAAHYFQTPLRRSADSDEQLLLPCICLVQVECTLYSENDVQHKEYWGGVADILHRIDSLMQFWNMYPCAALQVSGGPVVTHRASLPRPPAMRSGVCGSGGPMVTQGPARKLRWGDLGECVPSLQRLLNADMGHCGFNRVQPCTDWVNVEGHNFALLELAGRTSCQDCAALFK